MRTMKLKNTIERLSQIGLTVIAAAAFASCEVEQTEEGEMPKVDVQGGKLPKFDVDAPDVDVTMKKKTIEVTVPDVDVTPAKDNNDGDPNR